jgi:hypothetical protein
MQRVLEKWIMEQAKPDSEDTPYHAFMRRLENHWMRLGELSARAGDVLTVLRVRGIVVPDADRERILAEKDPVRLERWFERAVVAASIAEVMRDEPS